MIKEKLKKFKLVRIIQKYIIMKSGKSNALLMNGNEIIQQVDSVMNSFNIKYFIDFGTLLGIIRDGHLLSHDIDIDFGVINSDKIIKQTIYKALTEKGYRRTERYIVEEDTKEESYSNGSNKFDIFYYEHDENGNYCYIFNRIDGVKYSSPTDASVGLYRYNMDLIPERRSINGYEYSVPKNPEKLLSLKYGDSWRLPNKYWHYWYDAKVEITNKIANWVNS